MIEISVIKMQLVKFHILVLSFFCAIGSLAQKTDRDFIRWGNKYFVEGCLDDAETSYNKALDKNKSFEAHYNLANVHALNGKDSVAYAEYQNALAQPCSNVLKKAKAFHNMGNLMYANGCIQLKGQDAKATESFKAAVELYKSALRHNPSDNETRYNLAMAQYMLKNGQQNGDTGEDDKKQENEEKEEKKEEEQQQKQQQKEDSKESMSDDVVEKLLNSAQQDENAIQRKIQSLQGQGNRRQLEKDW